MEIYLNALICHQKRKRKRKDDSLNKHIKMEL